jgi:hypothetical protein
LPFQCVFTICFWPYCLCYFWAIDGCKLKRKKCEVIKRALFHFSVEWRVVFVSFKFPARRLRFVRWKIVTNWSKPLSLCPFSMFNSFVRYTCEQEGEAIYFPKVSKRDLFYFLFFIIHFYFCKSINNHNSVYIIWVYFCFPYIQNNDCIFSIKKKLYLIEYIVLLS